MSNRHRGHATAVREGAPIRLLPVMSDLRKEVRAMSRHAHKTALARASGSANDYRAQLLALFESWLDTDAPEVQLICFSSAAEFGLPMRHHAERCGAWAMQHGTRAHRALYWAALHRSRFGTTTKVADTPSREGYARCVGTPSMPLLPERWQKPCKLCESLRGDARNADGHEALRPLGDTRSCWIGAGALCQMREHQCAICGMRWTQHRRAADPFNGWTISAPRR